jgi:nucleoid-associated protein YgaU
VAALLLAATGARAEGKVHVVRPGESLSTIARSELGDLALWPVLYRANRDRIKDPARIYPGQQLTIPEPGSEAFGETEPPEPPPSEDGG